MYRHQERTNLQMQGFMSTVSIGLRVEVAEVSKHSGLKYQGDLENDWV